MSALFEDLRVRLLRNNDGYSHTSSGVNILYEQYAYSKGDSGTSFTKKLIDVCNEINSGVDLPNKFVRDRPMQWPLTVALMSRTLKYVPYNEDKILLRVSDRVISSICITTLFLTCRDQPRECGQRICQRNSLS